MSCPLCQSTMEFATDGPLDLKCQKCRLRGSIDTIDRIQGLQRELIRHRAREVRLLLFCPVCLEQHIDAPNPAKGWTDPPHKSHECQGCGHVWRPADVPTTGVEKLTTKGQCDGIAVPVIEEPGSAERLLLQAFHDAAGAFSLLGDAASRAARDPGKLDDARRAASTKFQHAQDTAARGFRSLRTERRAKKG